MTPILIPVLILLGLGSAMGLIRFLISRAKKTKVATAGSNRPGYTGFSDLSKRLFVHQAAAFVAGWAAVRGLNFGWLENGSHAKRLPHAGDNDTPPHNDLDWTIHIDNHGFSDYVNIDSHNDEPIHLDQDPVHIDEPEQGTIGTEGWTPHVDIPGTHTDLVTGHIDATAHADGHVDNHDDSTTHGDDSFNDWY